MVLHNSNFLSIYSQIFLSGLLDLQKCISFVSKLAKFAQKRQFCITDVCVNDTITPQSLKLTKKEKCWNVSFGKKTFSNKGPKHAVHGLNKSVCNITKSVCDVIRSAYDVITLTSAFFSLE